MRNPLRLLVLACASFIALAFAGTALAAYTPRLIINQQNYRPGAGGGVEIFVAIPQNDDATARILILAPPGYTATLTQAPGTRIGSVVARVKANALGGAVLPLTGNVTVANAADPTLQAAATRCTGTPTHNAIWVLNLTIQNQNLQIPVFVDVVNNNPRLTVCLGSPHVPEAQGGARFGAQLVVADFTVLGVFRNAGARGTYAWLGVFTPYAAGSALANSAGTVESRGIVPLPYSLTIRRAKGKGTAVRLTGTLTASGRPLRNARPEIYAATSARAQGTLVGRGTATNRAGRYTATRKAVKRRTWFHAEFGPADLGEAGCAGQGIARCVTSTLAPVISNTIRVNPPPRRRR